MLPRPHGHQQVETFAAQFGYTEKIGALQRETGPFPRAPVRPEKSILSIPIASAPRSASKADSAPRPQPTSSERIRKLETNGSTK